ncbi:dTDP-glucose 4,6-dehydratase/GDP-L-fucose synthase [Halomicrobium zhouii]|uniref:GDP-L-fucose synthase n=1 Tax=Halomicrobium zhouii TaxID=767519 RepID=A0A1I6KG61_9EURY|nr:GDP-L-fucose synthase [Halomicrobium zhouii]SFR90176.1 dTDP-glucose 4,6-dehydratase/GDP-L-fucose synthase [Halomicrobium zhouii]
MDLQGKRIVVTGGAGFLGSHVVEELESRGYSHITVPRSDQYDLRDPDDIQSLFDDESPDVVIHLAGTVGGIGVMDEKPGEIFYDNAIMGIELLEAARRADVEKFVSIGSVCAYPKHTSVPFDEESLWDGYPEETHAPYGIAKKLPLVQSQAYRQQYGFDGIYLLPVNLYGPRDDFDPETSHVIPSIIRKVDEAMRRGNDTITAWGTGEPTREFLYVEDAAEAIVEATISYDEPLPMNLGSSEEISIRELVNMIIDTMGFDGEIVWDRSKPDGQPRRCLDVSRAREHLNWEAATEFDDGLSETIEWYRDNRIDLIE